MLRKIQQYRDAIAACFQANSSPLSMRQILAWIDNANPGNDFSQSVVRSQVYKSCTNVPYTAKSSAPKILFFDRSANTYQRADTATVTALEESAKPSAERSTSMPQFGFEAHLQTSLVRDLSALEEGLTLWFTQPPSVEFTFDNRRRIDILAKDKDGVPVVIELKRGDAYDKVVGQALLYRGLLKSKLLVDRVRIFLVASIITDELKIACSTVGDVELFEYSVYVRAQRVSTALDEE